MSMTILTGTTSSKLKALFENVISANQINIQMANLNTELQNHAIIPYTKAIIDMRLFQGAKPFKSKWAIMKDQLLMQSPGVQQVKRHYKNDNSLFYVLNVLLTMPDKLNVVQKYADKFIPRDIAKEDMKYTQLNIIRLVESSEFITQYARRYLYWVLYNEGQSTNHGHLPKEPPFQPAVVKWLDNNFAAFVDFLTIWSYSTSTFSDRLSAIPPITVPSDVKEEEQVNDVYREKLDPMKIGFIPTVLNPIYYIRTMVLNYRHYRVESAKAEAEALAHDLECYQANINGELTQQQTQVIEKLREAVQKANARHKQLEEDFDKIYDL